MAPRSNEIPHATERSALQKLIVAGPLPFFKLHPAGKRTVSVMLKKGWIAVKGQKFG